MSTSWKNYFLDRGLPSDIANDYCQYVAKLENQNLPVIFEEEHLAKLLGLRLHILTSMVYSSDNYYRTFSVKKRAGGSRTIETPYPSLLQAQRWIYEKILLKTKVSPFAHGFIPGRSIVSNAKIHLNSKVLLKMDFQNFFPSIPISWVVNYFHSLGYANNTSYQLASLCCIDGRLSQGSVTSPYLSNILLRHLDFRLSKLCKKYRLNYSRYADDLTFSGDVISRNFPSIVKNIVEDYGLLLNEKKTRKILGSKKIVTGISVADGTLSIPRELKRKLRQEFHYIRKYGFYSHANKTKVRNPTYLSRLIGQFDFWLQVEPNNQFASGARYYLLNVSNQVTQVELA